MSLPPTRFIGPSFFHWAARDFARRLLGTRTGFVAIPQAMAGFGPAEDDPTNPAGEHHEHSGRRQPALRREAMFCQFFEWVSEAPKEHTSSASAAFGGGGVRARKPPKNAWPCSRLLPALPVDAAPRGSIGWPSAMLPLLPLMSLPRILSPLFLRLAHRLHLAVPGLCVVGQEAMEVTVGRSPSTAPSSVNTRSGKGSEASEAPMPSWGCWRLRNAGSGVPEARGAYGNSLLLQSSIRDPPCIYIYIM